ncbi:hypothetical protein BDQ17DRAFT_564130 [Cyathus striatus]|nr:hypothetical protein BDQ17DRAFT_564130 [Cyathus striatus]
MAATVNQATENNQKLFRQYTKKLSQDDTSVYASHADKLGRWLSDEKAYYKSARPEIVKLLLASILFRVLHDVAESEALDSPVNFEKKCWC